MVLRFDHANAHFHMEMWIEAATIFGRSREPFAVIVIINSLITSQHTCDYLNKNRFSSWKAPTTEKYIRLPNV